MTKLFKLIPQVTEKSVSAQTTGKYTFIIPKQVNKIMLKQEIEAAYGVKIVDVNILKQFPKTRSIGKPIMVKRPELKKAIITLKKGQSLDINKAKS